MSRHLQPCFLCPAAIVEVNSETDFVARNELFQKMVGQVAAAATGLEPKSGSHELDLEQVSMLMFVDVCLHSQRQVYGRYVADMWACKLCVLSVYSSGHAVGSCELELEHVTVGN